MMEQNTNEWLEHRRQGLGASDAPAVLGVSPWTTPYELWEEKARINVKDKSNWATKNGHNLEPKARLDYELNFNIDMPAALVVHKDYPFIRASLDGWNQEKNIVLEIKCPGQEDHKTALDGRVPEKYYPQLQHQLLVTGASELHYYSFHSDVGVLVRVFPDNNYITTTLFPALVQFWDLVQTKTPPPLTDRDWKNIRSKELKDRINTWKNVKASADSFALEEKRLRESILSELEDHPRWRCDDIDISMSFRSGSVDYAKIPELKNIDLEKYRKKGSTVWTMRVKK